MLGDYEGLLDVDLIQYSSSRYLQYCCSCSSARTVLPGRAPEISIPCFHVRQLPASNRPYQKRQI